MSLKKNVQNWLRRSLEDPIAKTLAKNSHLTATQLETLLIDALSDNLASKSLKYEEKAKLRKTKAAISRGSFNRTLRQAKRNIIKSIYTVLLLGYFGILENASLDPYLEAANRLNAYTKAHRDILKNNRITKEQLQIVSMLREELKAMFDQLSHPWASSQA
ncbi:MAG: hypothetical protein JSV51_04435 [Candidatus Bathyarchaeota archaeon]|nr:MAG: hypothetical protein JSV51_04435 [Candidatus Bathyarchaeota archaeon]